MHYVVTVSMQVVNHLNAECVPSEKSLDFDQKVHGLRKTFQVPQSVVLQNNWWSRRAANFLRIWKNF